MLAAVSPIGCMVGRGFRSYDARIMLQLPLWTVTEHVEISESASDSDIVLGTALAFSTKAIDLAANDIQL